MASTDEPITPTPKRRRRRMWAGIGVLLAGTIVFVVVYFEPQSAFIDDTVNESLSGLDSISTTTTVPTQAPATTITPNTGATENVATTTPVPTTVPVPANSVSASLAKAAETGQPVIVSIGTFVSGEHDTSGTALVVALPDGSLVVRFEDLNTSNGPDLRAVLSPEPASGSSDYDGRLNLGDLKGNIGDQNYAVESGVDLVEFQSVVIWCERFSVAFGAASIDVVA